MTDYKKTYNYWLEKVQSNDHRLALQRMKEQDIIEAFSGGLEFGTGGIRAVMGMGSSLLNEYTMMKIAKGTADYFLDTARLSESVKSLSCKSEHFAEGNPSAADNSFVADKSGSGGKNRRISEKYGIKQTMVIAYDNRINSRLFARLTARVFAASGITAILTKTCMPTPYLSFMVRKLKAAGGVMITASHNPKQYNGYKLYGADGCQLLEGEADRAACFIKNTDPFADSVLTGLRGFGEYQKNGLIKLTGAHKAYVAAVTDALGVGSCAHKRLKNEGLYKEYDYKKSSAAAALKASIESELRIIYTPLCGTGGFLAEKLLKNEGMLFIVPKQAAPDGEFAACPVSNPEKPEAFEMALSYAKKFEADLVLASDPDADRMGAVARNKSGGFDFLTGNQIGILLTDFILSENLKALRNGRKEICAGCVGAFNAAGLNAGYAGFAGLNSLGSNFGHNSGLCEKLNKSAEHFGFCNSANTTNNSEYNSGYNDGANTSINFESNSGYNDGANTTNNSEFNSGHNCGANTSINSGLFTEFDSNFSDGFDSDFGAGGINAVGLGSLKPVKNPVIVRTIVSTPMTDEIARCYGAEIVKVPTGFKYIGDTIARLEQRGQGERFLLGFEESHGYLSGTYARDKDGLLAAALLARYAARLKSQGSTLSEALTRLYERHGYYLHKTISYRFEGVSGAGKIREFMQKVRLGEFLRGAGDFKITDYSMPSKVSASTSGTPDCRETDCTADCHVAVNGNLDSFKTPDCNKANCGETVSGNINSFQIHQVETDSRKTNCGGALDKSANNSKYTECSAPLKDRDVVGAVYPAVYPADMVEYSLGGTSIIVRPSGTEPFVKAYLSVKANSPAEAEEILARYKTLCDEFFV